MLDTTLQVLCMMSRFSTFLLISCLLPFAGCDVHGTHRLVVKNTGTIDADQVSVAYVGTSFEFGFGGVSPGIHKGYNTCPERLPERVVVQWTNPADQRMKQEVAVEKLGNDADTVWIMLHDDTAKAILSYDG